MKTFPEPYRTDSGYKKQAPDEPGYRFLGKDEVLREGDECWQSIGEWCFTDCVGEKVGYGMSNSTYRRPICEDDKNAPPPEEWVKEGWEVITSGNITLDSEYWYNRQWKPNLGRTTCCADQTDLYYRRPISPSMNTESSAPSAPKRTLKPGQTIVVNVHKSQALSRAVQEVAFAAGWDWQNVNRADHIEKPIKEYGHEGAVIYLKPDKDMAYSGFAWALNERKNDLFLDARTDMGLLIDLLEKPAIVAPKINGYEAKYIKGEGDAPSIVRFGCADLSMRMLNVAANLMRFTQVSGVGPWRECNPESMTGNRTVRAIELDSGVKLTRDEVKAILDYVEAVNKS